MEIDKSRRPEDCGKVLEKIDSKCPRCGLDCTILKTTKYFITQCEKCGFDMGMPREEHRLCEGCEQPTNECTCDLATQD